MAPTKLYVVAYSLPHISGSVKWMAYPCEAADSTDAVRQCCTEIPSAKIETVLQVEELLTYPDEEET